MRPVKQIIGFKQIIGRGTRLLDGKDFFTIYDFADAWQRFLDPEWMVSRHWKNHVLYVGNCLVFVKSNR